jgi:hypothetical protein
MNFDSSPGSNPSTIDGGAGGADVISRDAFDEESDGEGPPPQSGTESNVASAPPERGPTLTEEQRRLLAMSNYSWDSIAVRYISSSQDIMDLFGQQNFTQQKPAEPGAEPLFLSDRIAVDVDRNRNEGEIIDIETPVDSPTVNAEEDEQEEEPQDDQQEEENSDSGQGSEDDQPEETEEEGDSGSGSNSTGTNSTSSEGSSDSSGSGDGSSDEDSGIGASISIG